MKQSKKCVSKISIDSLDDISNYISWIMRLIVSLILKPSCPDPGQRQKNQLKFLF